MFWEPITEMRGDSNCSAGRPEQRHDQILKGMKRREKGGRGKEGERSGKREGDGGRTKGKEGERGEKRRAKVTRGES